MNSLLNKTIPNNKRNLPKNIKEVKTDSENDFSINTENNKESTEIPPERDIRDPQPTISVNYRVIKDNGKNESNDKNKNIISKRRRS